MIRWRIPGWRVSPFSLFLLGLLTALILFIVLVPDDIDLPDTAFHRGTAPLAIRALGTSAPIAVIIAFLCLLLILAESLQHTYLVSGEVYFSSNFLPILLRTIRR